MKHKLEFTIKWCGKPGQEEYIARCPTILDVSGHSRHPGSAFVALLRKLIELDLVDPERDWR